MSLFEPYSHTRLQELRQEQLARKARRQGELCLDRETQRQLTQSIAQTVHALTARFARSRSTTADRRSAGHPALDS